MKFRFKINRVVVIWSVVVLLTVLGGFFVVKYVEIQADKDLRSRWLVAIEAAAAAVNPDRVASLTPGGSDQNTADYKRLSEQLRFVSQAVAVDNLHPLYLMLEKNGQIYIEIDAAETGSSEYAPPSVEYSDAPTELLSLFSTSGSVSAGPYTDRWGTFISSFVSLSDKKTGQPVAVLGADAPYEYWKRTVTAWRLGATAVFLLIVFIEFLFLFYFYRRKRFETKIRESEGQLRSIIETIPDVVFRLDPLGKIIYVSQVMNGLSGYNPTTLVGKNLAGFFSSGEQEIFRQTLNELRTGTIKNRVLPFTAVRATGEFKFVDVYLSTLTREGQVFEIQGLLRDVDESRRNNEQIKQRAEEATKIQKAVLNILEDVEEEKKRSENLAAELEKFKLAVDNVSDHIVITDAEGIVLYSNAAMEKITGYTAAESMGKKAAVLWRLPMSEDYYKKFWDTIKVKKKNFVGDIQNRRKTGEIYDAKISVSPILNHNGEVAFFVGIERDITKEKEVDRAKTEFVSLASHQLRTPLTAINWYVEMLTSGYAGALNIEQKQYLDVVYKSSKRMVGLVNALLNVSRLELGTFTIEPKDCRITEIADSVIDELKPQIDTRRQIFVKEYDPATPIMLLDEKLIRIVFQNLLSNAVKYTQEEGSIKLEIKVKGKNLEILVIDSGLGIPKTQQDKIFSKLFRADNVRETDTEGTGLGLYIVKAILDQSGGTIEFKSEENKGTTFTVVLPLKGMVKKEGTKSLS
ncbi:MAG: PAS domain S-box protein [Patescibacteria group bacterium]|jgi:PAS domain S-box-containing protein